MRLKKLLTKILKGVAYSIGVIITLFIFWAITSNILTSIEKKNNLPIGKMVEVDGKKMHVFTKGNGKDTIVLLSGLGTPAPAIDFMPLMDELSKNYKVAVVEYFGCGWSDTTDKERTVENIVEETRTALKESGIQGPYILMPHSISGIYSMYYVNKYPKEVKAIIGIDCTLPKVGIYFGASCPPISNSMALLAPTGIARLTVLIKPDSYLPVAEPGTYSKENLKLMKMISSWKGYNKNVVAEMKECQNNMNKTINMSYPKKMPVLIFTKEYKKREDGKTNASFYETYLNDLESSKLIVLQGHHYLHWTNSKQMANSVNEFLNNNLK